MIEPQQLLGVAKSLAEPPKKGAPKQVKLRRAISSSYYALFHCFAASAADLLARADARGTQRYLAIYRSFEHKRMADVCRHISAGSQKTEDGSSFHPTLRQCAAAFVELQESRHDADYDPFKKFALSDAQAAISKASDAIQNLRASPDEERLLFLTSLHFKLRS
jgi:uncharacterized protein (UPF0332 family)